MGQLILNVLTRLKLYEFDLLIHGLKHHEKLQALKALGLKKLRSKKKQAEFAQIIDKLTNLNTERNIAVHGQWEPIGGATLGESLGGFGPDHELRAAHAVNRKGKGKTTKLSAKRLEDLADSIATHCEELMRFWTANWLTSRQKEGIEAIWKRQGNPARVLTMRSESDFDNPLQLQEQTNSPNKWRQARSTNVPVRNNRRVSVKQVNRLEAREGSVGKRAQSTSTRGSSAL